MHVHKAAHVMTATSPAHRLLNIYNVHTQHLEQPHIFSSRSSMSGVMKAILVTSPQQKPFSLSLIFPCVALTVNFPLFAICVWSTLLVHPDF